MKVVINVLAQTISSERIVDSIRGATTKREREAPHEFGTIETRERLKGDKTWVIKRTSLKTMKMREKGRGTSVKAHNRVLTKGEGQKTTGLF